MWQSGRRQSGLTRWLSCVNSLGFQLATHLWNVVFNLLAQKGSEVPNHHTHIPGTGLEEQEEREQRGRAGLLKGGFQTLAGDTLYNLLARTWFVTTLQGQPRDYSGCHMPS